MKILFITSRFPYPTVKGDKIRAYYPIKYLSMQHEIDLISISEEAVNKSQIDEMENYCNRVEIIYLNKTIYYLKLLAGIISPWPSQIICYKSKRMKKRVRYLILSSNYDIVHIICGRIVCYAKQVENIPVIIDWIDAQSLVTKRMFKAEKLWPKKILYYFEWKKMEKYERQAISECDYSYITSPVDRTYLNNKIDQVIPNGVDTTLFRPLNIKKEHDLIFTGNMSYFSNIKAVDLFCNEIFPSILRDQQKTTFFIVGINPKKNVLRYHDGRNIFVTGFVNNLTEVLCRSKIFVAPLLSGGGIQNKILEAMACSIPVVTTSFGNAGIQAEDGSEIIIRDDPEEFSDAVKNLLSNVTLRDEIGKNGFAFVNKKYSWTSIKDIFNDIYSKFSVEE